MFTLQKIGKIEKKKKRLPQTHHSHCFAIQGFFTPGVVCPGQSPVLETLRSNSGCAIRRFGRPLA